VIEVSEKTLSNKIVFSHHDCDTSLKIVRIAPKDIVVSTNGLDLPNPLFNGKTLIEVHFNQTTYPIQVEADQQSHDTIKLIGVDDHSISVIWLLNYLSQPHNKPPKKNPETLQFTNKTLPKLPARGNYTPDARVERLNFLETHLNTELPHFRASDLDAELLKKNVENYIGTVKVPVGVAGPLLFNGQNATNFVYAPIATTEGALVSTITKGAQAVSRSQGVRTRVLDHRLTRVPVFDFYHAHDVITFKDWVLAHFDEIKQQAKKYSSYAELTGLNPSINGLTVSLEFIYTTGDAAGQNMTTTCTWHACLWIKEIITKLGINIKDLMVEALASSDKKASYSSFIKGRGIRVMAEASISEEITNRVLGTTSENIVLAYQRVVSGCIQSGVIGVNVNVANLIAGIFTATGQDIACVHESSVSHLYLEKSDTGFYVSLLLPSLVIGTVGGGTHLPDQNESLKMLGCLGPGSMSKLAEIIAGFALSLDIATLSALDNGRFPIAHEKMGRNRPVDTFKLDEFSASFFESGFRTVYHDSDLRVAAVSTPQIKLGSSIITEMTSRKVNKLVGLFPFTVTYLSHGSQHKKNVIAKVKPVAKEVIMMLNIVASNCQSALASEYEKVKNQTGFYPCDQKELAIYRQTDPRFVTHVPQIFTLYEEQDREAYIIVMELLQDVILKDTANDTTCWKPVHIDSVLDGLAELHAIWFNQEKKLQSLSWIGHYATADSMLKKQPLWRALVENASEEYHWFTQEDAAIRLRLIDTIELWWSAIETMPKTLIHNDFNPRNMALRKLDSGFKLCVYDWELATIHLPQYDLAEFLIFTLQPDAFSKEEVLGIVHQYRTKLETAVDQTLDADQWADGFKYCLWDYTIFRMGLYLMVQSQRDYAFMDRIHKVNRQLLTFFAP